MFLLSACCSWFSSSAVNTWPKCRSISSCPQLIIVSMFVSVVSMASQTGVESMVVNTRRRASHSCCLLHSWSVSRIVHLHCSRRACQASSCSRREASSSRYSCRSTSHLRRRCSSFHAQKRRTCASRCWYKAPARNPQTAQAAAKGLQKWVWSLDVLSICSYTRLTSASIKVTFGMM